jgi:hypothetical protein
MEVVANTSSQAIGIRGRASDGASIISFHPNASSTEYARIQSDNTSALIFGTGSSATEGMRLTSTGLGIGTSSPAYKLNIVEAKTLTPTTGDGQITIDNSTSGQVSAILFSSQATRRAQISAGLGGTGNDGYLAFTTRNDSTGFGERARIDSSGNLILGTTSATEKLRVYSDMNANWGIGMRSTAGAVAQNYIQFVISAGGTPAQVGSITSNGTITVYGTTSDYRLKNTIAPMTGALDKVALLKPCTYKWNSNGSNGEGFIAHELAEVVPDCVSGAKDAVDADGNPVYQGIDTSFLVATLTAALQEAHGLIKSLETRITALEAK